MADELSKILEGPEIDWAAADVPRARRFSDFYYDAADPLGEVSHVFLAGIGAPQVWEGRSQFAIGETGFGSGLNFLATWRRWEESAPSGAGLDYVAVEGFPLREDDLARALRRFPELTARARRLIARYPPANRGVHRLAFAGGRVRLTLLYGEAVAALSGYEAAIDAWYLDGFAPAKNPDMWRPEIFAEIARLSSPGARIASFTAAGSVRRGLERHGFRIERRPGFGTKRHAIAGSYEGGSRRRAKRPASLAVIGGGIAGCAAAHAARARGLEVTLIERRAGLATGASGHAAALFKPRLQLGNETGPRFLAAAALYGGQIYGRLAREGADIWRGARGAVELASDQAAEARLQRIAAVYGWPGERMRSLDAGALSEVIGAAPPAGGLYFPAAGMVAPAALCPALARGARRIEAAAGAITRAGGTFTVRNEGGAVLAEAGAVVIAAGMETERFMGRLPSPLRANRGQLGYLPATEKDLPKIALGYGGYLSPRLAIPGFGEGHLLGASFDDWPKDRLGTASVLRSEDFAADFARLGRFWPQLAARWDGPAGTGRASIRATTPDHMPLAGRLGRDGPWVLAGLGARGFLTAPLAAEIVVCRLLETPPPVDRGVVAGLDPRRFENRPRPRAGQGN